MEKGLRETGALHKEPPDGGSLLTNRVCWYATSGAVGYV
jgi:hypothetical protein